MKPVIPETMEQVAKTAACQFFAQESPPSTVKYNCQMFYSYPAMIDNTGTTYLRYWHSQKQALHHCTYPSVLFKPLHLPVGLPDKKRFDLIMPNNFKLDQLVSDELIALMKKEQVQVIVKDPR